MICAPKNCAHMQRVNPNRKWLYAVFNWFNVFIANYKHTHYLWRQLNSVGAMALMAISSFVRARSLHDRRTHADRGRHYRRWRRCTRNWMAIWRRAAIVTCWRLFHEATMRLQRVCIYTCSYMEGLQSAPMLCVNIRGFGNPHLVMSCLMKFGCANVMLLLLLYTTLTRCSGHRHLVDRHKKHKSIYL